MNNQPEDFRCHCGDWRFKNGFFMVDEIRRDVCRNLPFYGGIDEKQYCVLHYPSIDKAEDFEIVYQQRSQEEIWDFRMVYFPKYIEHEREIFSKSANFSHATFANEVSFKYCEFTNSLDFFNSIFLQDVFFTYSNFRKQVNFNSADFRRRGYFAGTNFFSESSPSFNGAKFQKGNFASAKFETPSYGRGLGFKRIVFTDSVDFSRAKFLSSVDFEDAVLPDKGRADFEEIEFHRSVNFKNVNFFDASFRDAKFCLENKSFERTEFKYCNFDKSVSFNGAKFFQKVDFEKATFQNAHFENAVFARQANFYEAKFESDVFFNSSKFGYKDDEKTASGSAHFDGAEFGNNSRVYFDNTWFSWQTSFDYVRFDGYVFFKGSSSNPVFDSVFEQHASWGLISFRNATIDKPEKVYFQTVRLRPSWFVNSVFDLRKINLIDIDWGGGSGKPFDVNKELKALEKRVKHNSKKLLSVTFRQLADNAESSNRFEESSQFRYMAFETEKLIRKERQRDWWGEPFLTSELINNFSRKIRDAPFDLAYYFYRITSFYGENSNKAFRWLLGIILVSSILYCLPLSQFSDKGNIRSLYFIESVFYSLRVMVLQRPEPYPENLFAKGIVTLESVFAPLQLALLALAIRRKFMR